MRSRELTVGRQFGVVFEHGEDFFPTLADFCRANGVRQGYIPMFLAAFEEVEVVGACEKVDNIDAPVWSKVHLDHVEAFGCGTLAYDAATEQVVPHIHAALGEKARSAMGHTSHLLSAKVQFLTEMLLVEVTAPTMTRPKNAAMFDVPLLTFS